MHPVPSHYSTIGCRIDSVEALVSLAERVLPATELLAAEDGRYRRWSSSSGAELWLQEDAAGALIGIAPHFRGPSRVRLGSVSGFTREEAPTLDGAFHAWADPGQEEDSGAYPLVFDCPDFKRAREGHVGRRATGQIAAFAHDVKLYDDAAAFEAGQEGPVRFAAQSFIPIGLLPNEGKTSEAPEAYALFTGRVKDSELLMNELFERTFCWAAVETLGGSYDVVIDPELLPKAPVPGNVVSGTFWLSGRLFPSP